MAPPALRVPPSAPRARQGLPLRRGPSGLHRAALPFSASFARTTFSSELLKSPNTNLFCKTRSFLCVPMGIS